MGDGGGTNVEEMAHLQKGEGEGRGIRLEKAGEKLSRSSKRKGDQG